MAVILVYVVLVLIGDAGAVLVAAQVERFSQSISLAVFFVLFALVFWISWVIAVHIAERFIEKRPSP